MIVQASYSAEPCDMSKKSLCQAILDSLHVTVTDCRREDRDKMIRSFGQSRCVDLSSNSICVDASLATLTMQK